MVAKAESPKRLQKLDPRFEVIALCETAKGVAQADRIAALPNVTALMWGEINIKDGRVQQTNFHDYKMLRMDDAARIDTYVIDSNEPPGGVGEPATALVAPAVCNAIYTATGRRLRSLPLSRHRLA